MTRDDAFNKALEIVEEFTANLQMSTRDQIRLVNRITDELLAAHAAGIARQG